MLNKDRANTPPLESIRFCANWLLTTNGWVFEPIWWDQ